MQGAAAAPPLECAPACAVAAQLRAYAERTDIVAATAERELGRALQASLAAEQATSAMLQVGG